MRYRGYSRRRSFWRPWHGWKPRYRRHEYGRKRGGRRYGRRGYSRKNWLMRLLGF